MSTTGLVTEDLQASPVPSQPRRVAGLAGIAIVVSLVGTLLLLVAGKWLRDYNDGNAASTIVAAALVVASLYSWRAIFAAFAANKRRSAMLADGRLVDA